MTPVTHLIWLRLIHGVPRPIVAATHTLHAARMAVLAIDALNHEALGIFPECADTGEITAATEAADRLIEQMPSVSEGVVPRV